MAFLILLKSPGGATPGERIKLDSEPVVIGRDSEVCQLVIPNHAVSRRHAQVVLDNGQFYIEDLKSRNHTYLNNKEVTVRTPLKDDDRLKICDFLFRFQDETSARLDPIRQGGTAPVPLPPEMKREMAEPEVEEPDRSSTIETMGRVSPQHFLEVQPADRLRALLDISTALSKTLETDALLDRVGEIVFQVFKQSDRCFIIMVDEATGQLQPKVIKTRRPSSGNERFSRTIVKKCIESLQSFLIEDAASDANFNLSQSIADFRIRSVMCAPLATQDGKAVGVLQLDSQDNRTKKFNQDDLRLLIAVANQASTALENARLHEAMVTREKERQEVELAREVQRGFLPQSFPEVAGYEFYAHYGAAQLVGGDYYDFVTLPDGRVAVLLGDVAGKGVPAALLMAKLSAEGRYCVLTQPDAASAVRCLNDQLIQGGLMDRFVTLAAMILDPKTNTVSITNAGQMAPQIYRRDKGTLEDAIDNNFTGLPLGVMPGYEYEMASIELGPGDSIMVFSDGVSDAMNPTGKLFQMSGVVRAVQDDSALADATPTPKTLGQQVIRAVQAHANGRAQNDDIALVCFGRIDAGGGPNTSGPSTGAIPAGATQRPAAQG
jgi:serine phosphatase RsbU (regulator of sigma subunit)